MTSGITIIASFAFHVTTHALFCRSTVIASTSPLSIAFRGFLTNGVRQTLLGRSIVMRSGLALLLNIGNAVLGIGGG